MMLLRDWNGVRALFVNFDDTLAGSDCFWVSKYLWNHSRHCRDPAEIFEDFVQSFTPQQHVIIFAGIWTSLKAQQLISRVRHCKVAGKNQPRKLVFVIILPHIFFFNTFTFYQRTQYPILSKSISIDYDETLFFVLFILFYLISVYFACHKKDTIQQNCNF